jgi:hypothetical protein
MAWLSWHVIEKRAMSLKDWGPGRGLRYWWDTNLERRRRAKAIAQSKGDGRAMTPPTAVTEDGK